MASSRTLLEPIHMKILALGMLLANFCGVASLFAQNTAGGSVYVDVDNTRQLVLSGDGAFSLNYTADYLASHATWRLRQISYGMWRREGDFVVLNSSDEFMSDRLAINGEENVDESVEGIRIEVSNPYEKTFGGEPRRLFRYILYIDTNDEGLSGEVMMEGSCITIPIDSGVIVNGLWVFVVPDPYLYPAGLAFNFLRTEYYSVNNRATNWFRLNIPSLDIEYIGLMRFSEEYVRITSDGALVLRGKKFVVRDGSVLR